LELNQYAVRETKIIDDKSANVAIFELLN